MSENSQNSKKRDKNGKSGIFRFWVYVVIFLAVAFVGVYVANNVFGLSARVVSSPSMRPNLEVGDIILIQRTGSESINVGDIIVFYRSLDGRLLYDEVPLVHRVIKKSDSTLTTKGDANPTPLYSQPYNEGNVTMDRVLGKVVLNVPKLGLVTVAVEGIPYNVRLALGASLVLLIFLLDYMDWRKSSHRGSKQS